MNIDRLFKAMTVSATGMRAERFRMGIIASNIAHARDTNIGDGTPYRRKDAVFATILDGEMAGGVEILDTVTDRDTPLNKIYMKGHPQADENGMVSFPNVNPHNEMVDLIISSRSYEANLEVGKIAVEMARQALELGRG